MDKLKYIPVLFAATLGLFARQACAEQCANGYNASSVKVSFLVNPIKYDEKSYKDFYEYPIKAQIDDCHISDIALHIYRLYSCTNMIEEKEEGDKPVENDSCGTGYAKSNIIVTLKDIQEISDKVTGIVQHCIPISPNAAVEVPAEYRALGVCIATDLFNQHYEVPNDAMAITYYLKFEEKKPLKEDMSIPNNGHNVGNDDVCVYERGKHITLANVPVKKGNPKYCLGTH